MQTVFDLRLRGYATSAEPCLRWINGINGISGGA